MWKELTRTRDKPKAEDTTDANCLTESESELVWCYLVPHSYCHWCFCSFQMIFFFRFGSFSFGKENTRRI